MTDGQTVYRVTLERGPALHAGRVVTLPDGTLGVVSKGKERQYDTGSVFGVHPPHGWTETPGGAVEPHQRDMVRRHAAELAALLDILPAPAAPEDSPT